MDIRCVSVRSGVCGCPHLYPSSGQRPWASHVGSLTIHIISIDGENQKSFFLCLFYIANPCIQKKSFRPDRIQSPPAPPPPRYLNIVFKGLVSFLLAMVHAQYDLSYYLI